MNKLSFLDSLNEPMRKNKQNEPVLQLVRETVHCRACIRRMLQLLQLYVAVYGLFRDRCCCFCCTVQTLFACLRGSHQSEWWGSCLNSSVMLEGFSGRVLIPAWRRKFLGRLCACSRYHWENYISFYIKWDMIVMTVFLSILNQIEFHSVQNRKENRHHDYIPFNVKGNIVFSV